MSKSSQNKFWSAIGKIGALLAAIWIAIQIVTFFLEPNEYQIKIDANHYPYKIAYSHDSIMSEYLNIVSLDKTYVNSVDENGISIDRLLAFNESEEVKEFAFFSYNYRILKSSLENEIGDFNEVWTFNLKNNSNKPLEEVLIEIPFEGRFKSHSQKGITSKGEFKNRVPIGNLAPGYSTAVTVWVKNYSFIYPELTEEKTRITHKYGWQKINYPVKIDGLAAWNKRNNNTPIAIILTLLIGSIFLSFSLGKDQGNKVRTKNRVVKKDTNEVEKTAETS